MGHKNIPLTNGHAHAAAFERCGWVREPQRQGSNHIILTKSGHRNTLSVPCHSEVKRAVIQKLIQRAGLTEEEYLSCFRRKGR